MEEFDQWAGYDEEYCKRQQLLNDLAWHKEVRDSLYGRIDREGDDEGELEFRVTQRGRQIKEVEKKLYAHFLFLFIPFDDFERLLHFVECQAFYITKAEGETNQRYADYYWDSIRHIDDNLRSWGRDILRIKSWEEL